MGTALRLLIVEDSEDDAALVIRELTRGGFDVTVQRIDSAAAMTAAIHAEKWDLILSDYSMPHFSGFDALNMVRSNGLEVPFIFVSGTIGEETAVAALKCGAQDYLMKSNLSRLVPAVQRELREYKERQERKRLELQVRQLQRFESIGLLAGGIAHDFNNVIAAILSWATLGYDELPPDNRFRERFKKIHDQAQRAAGLTRQLLAFARRQILQTRNIDLNGLVTETLNLLRKVIGAQIQVQILQAPNLGPVWADPSQAEQVLTNLCLNARDAMPQGGKLHIETKKVEIGEDRGSFPEFVRPGSYALLSVSDTGMGMDAQTMEHVFEPFYTTKELGQGTGLGLATVYGIVKQHNGYIFAESEVNHGTTFRVYLPVGTGPVEVHKEIPAIEVRGGTETVLMAEDHEGLREAVREILGALGYRVLFAANGKEALRLFLQHQESIDLLLLDVVMPLMSGPDALAQMRAIRPEIPVIFTTGYSSESALLESMVKDSVVILQKPYAPNLLGRKIRDVLDHKC